MEETVELITEINVRGLNSYPSIFEKFSKVKKWTENRLIIFLIFYHVISVMVPKVVSSDRNKVSTVNAAIFS